MGQGGAWDDTRHWSGGGGYGRRVEGAEERGEAGEHIEEDLQKKCAVRSRRFCALGRDSDLTS